MKRSSPGKGVLVFALAAAAWLVPLWWTLRQKSTQAIGSPNDAPPAPSPGATKPLLLYVEAWPTRRKLDLNEIQGLTGESESTLAPARVAESLYSALGGLGITPEIHRIDKVPETLDLGKFRPVVFIYPVRHGQPAPEVGFFFDKRVEKFIAEQHGKADLSVSDIAIGETTADTLSAQSSFATMNRYYSLPYRAGTVLSPEQSLREERQRITTQAAAIRKEASR